MKLLKIPSKSFSLEEHLEYMNIGPFEKPIEMPFVLYETLHIVDTFDQAIVDITSMIIDGYNGKQLNLIKKDDDIFWPTDIWYFPGNSRIYGNTTKPEGSIEIYIKLLSLQNNNFMNACPREEDNEHIVIDLNIGYLRTLYDKMPPDEVKLCIIQALKHEFKHIRTIWANPEKDILYSKRYSSFPTMSKFELEAMHKYGYTIVNTKELCYYLNPEEALAHINGIFAKIQHHDPDSLLELVHRLNKEFNYSNTLVMSRIIEIFDKGYYFNVLSDLLKTLETLCQESNNFLLQYELYNFQFHAYKLGFYYSFYKKNKLNLDPEISIKEFKDKDIDERIGASMAALQIIKYNIAEIKRKLISAVSNYISKLSSDKSKALQD